MNWNQKIPWTTACIQVISDGNRCREKGKKLYNVLYVTATTTTTTSNTTSNLLLSTTIFDDLGPVSGS